MNKQARAAISAGSVLSGSDSVESLAVQAAEHLTRVVIDGDFKPLANDFATEHDIALNVAVEFVKQCDSIVKTVGELAGKYQALCIHIRKSQLAPKPVAKMLKVMGFHKNVISKINAVASLPDDLWRKYAAREIGFNKVLALKRGSPVLELAGVPLEEFEQHSIETEEASVAPRVALSGAELRRRDRVRLHDGAKLVLQLAANLKTKSQSWDIGNGFVLKLSRSVVATGLTKLPPEVEP